MNIIVAHTEAHGRFFARNVKLWKPTEYQIVVDRVDSLRGLKDCTVWFLEAPRHDTTSRQHENRYAARMIIQPQLHRIKVQEARLP